MCAARVAAAHAKGKLKFGDGWTYHSIVSNAFQEGGFIGQVAAEITASGIENGVTVSTEGRGWYTGASTFTVEFDDLLGQTGFNLRDLARVES